MHVAEIIHGYAPRIGGAERQLGALAPQLIANGVDVSVITRRLPETSAFEMIDGVPVYRLPVPGPKPLASLFFTLSVQFLVKKLRPDLIHAHEMISPATAAYIAHKLYKIPFVITPHLSGPQGDVQRMNRKLFGNARLSMFAREASAFVTISSEIDSELNSIAVAAERRTFIGNGVDAVRFSPVEKTVKGEKRSNLGIPEQSLVAVFVGRLVPQKRLDLLIGIWPVVREKYADAVLLVLGSGPMENEYKQSRTEGVVFLGNREDITEVLHTADVFILPSDAEGLAVSLLESMSSGLACVATAVGGAPDVLVNGENGILIPRGDRDALLKAILLLFGDQGLRERLGKKARELILQKYTVAAVSSQLIDLYQKVLLK